MTWSTTRSALTCGLALGIGPGSATAISADTDHFEGLTPLSELYSANAPDRGYDLAGIRCAALYYAQFEYAKTHSDVRPHSKNHLSAGEKFLELSDYHRREAGQSAVDAVTSTEKDALRTIGAYIGYYQANAKADGHPWKGDRLIEGDLAYCEALGR